MKDIKIKVEALRGEDVILYHSKKIGANTEYPIDFRLIAATNRNLEEMVERDEFRLNLYCRLHRPLP